MISFRRLVLFVLCSYCHFSLLVYHLSDYTMCVVMIECVLLVLTVYLYAYVMCLFFVCLLIVPYWFVLCSLMRVSILSDYCCFVASYIFGGGFFWGIGVVIVWFFRFNV